MKKVLFILVCALMSAVNVNAQETYSFNDIQGMWVADKILNNRNKWVDAKSSIVIAFTDINVDDDYERCYSLVVAMKDSMKLPYVYDETNNRITIYYPYIRERLFMQLDIEELSPTKSMVCYLALGNHNDVSKIKFKYVKVD